MIIGSNLLGDVDNQGNNLYIRVFYNENKENVSANIYLKLASENKTRLLGRYDYHNKTLYCSRKMSKHYHYAAKGFGFNSRILDDPYLSIQRIHILIDEETHYEFPNSLIKNFGRFLNFKQQGFELQKFISLNLIKTHSILPAEINKELLNDTHQF